MWIKQPVGLTTTEWEFATNLSRHSTNYWFFSSSLTMVILEKWDSIMILLFWRTRRTTRSRKKNICLRNQFWNFFHNDKVVPISRMLRVSSLTRVLIQQIQYNQTINFGDEKLKILKNFESFQCDSIAFKSITRL